METGLPGKNKKRGSKEGEHRRELFELVDKESKESSKSLSHLKPFFLETIKETGLLLASAKKHGVTMQTIMNWIKNDPQFAQDYEMAQREATEKMEAAALHRAVNGVERTLYYSGKPCVDPVTKKPYTYREFSDELLRFLLTSRDRDKYGPRVAHQLDIRIAHQISAEFVRVVRKVEPMLCDKCRTHVKLSEKISEELKSMSSKLVSA